MVIKLNFQFSHGEDYIDPSVYSQITLTTWDIKIFQSVKNTNVRKKTLDTAGDGGTFQSEVFFEGTVNR